MLVISYLENLCASTSNLRSLATDLALLKMDCSDGRT